MVCQEQWRQEGLCFAGQLTPVSISSSLSPGFCTALVFHGWTATTYFCHDRAGNDCWKALQVKSKGNLQVILQSSFTVPPLPDPGMKLHLSTSSQEKKKRQPSISLEVFTHDFCCSMVIVVWFWKPCFPLASLVSPRLFFCEGANNPCWQKPEVSNIYTD